MRPPPRLLLLALAACVCSAEPEFGTRLPRAPSALPDPAPAHPAPLTLAPAATRNTRSTDKFLQLLSEYAREAMESERASRGAAAAARPLRLDLPLAAGEGGVTLPLLVLPVPVPVQGQGCSAQRYDDSRRDNYLDDYDDYDAPRRPPPRRQRPRQRPRPRPAYDRYFDDDQYERPRRPLYDERPQLPEQPLHQQQALQLPQQPLHQQQALQLPQQPQALQLPQQPNTVNIQIQQRGPELPARQDFPRMERVVSSQQLVQQFQKQIPTAPQLPPAVIQRFTREASDSSTSFASSAAFTSSASSASSETFDRSGYHYPNPAATPAPGGYHYPQPAGTPAPAPTPADYHYPKPAVTLEPAGYHYPKPRDARAPRGFSLPGAQAQSRYGRGAAPDFAPPRPRFATNLMIRAELTVPRSDYTEPYTVWYDGASGAARTELHGGATTTLKIPSPDGTFQMVELKTDRSGGMPTRRCGVAPPLRPNSRAPPALPDIDLFDFDGYVEAEGGRAERWTRVVASAAGAGGAARGERLTHTHEVLLTRRGDAAVPLKYSVSVDSSVLGARCDAYEHRYLEVREQAPPPEMLNVDLGSWCQQTEPLDARRSEHAARLDPLREFTLPARDPRYDEAFQLFTKEFEREFVDDTEVAVRKNLFVQHTRFVTSCNREGASFETGVNFLGDRLDAELDALLGVELEGGGDASMEDFPHAEGELPQLEKELPDEFDWRPEGAVTHVRYQGSCSSCWAMAVTGAVEGALFIRTGKLVPLAEQTLVDCAHSHGAHGCNGTWPSRAYDYVQARGLPALAEYGEHKERVEACRAPPVEPVTRISAHVNVTSGSVPALKVAIRRHAPTVVIIDAKAKSFIFYKKGVLFDDRCGKKSPRLNHAVLAVGWGTEGGAPHFIVKNSWSAAWGEGGAARLQAPANTCGVLALPSYPRLERPDVIKLT